jgi:glycosyltransferase involved in cell wall biosynthesis
VAFQFNTTAIKITIITPSFNQGQYIEETIRSVLSQNYPNLEYIIVDGGSTDNTIEIIKKYESHLSYWISEPDRGQSHAINKGLAKATGDIFNWLNSDDTLMPNSLATVAENFQKNNPIVVCGYTQAYWEDGKTELNRVTVPTDIEAIPLGRMSQQSLFYDLKLLKSSNNAFVNEELHFCMDLDLWTRFAFSMAKIGRKDYCFIDQILGRLRFHNSSKSMTNSQDFDLDKCKIALNILGQSNINTSIFNKIQASKLPQIKNYKLETDHLNPQKLTAYAIEMIIDRANQYFTYKDFLHLYFISLKLQTLNRFRFSTLPIRLLKRKFLGISIHK